ncbi:MAG: hypothetical protein HQL54_03345 [Magnetococcales bacterium]|nr:hypothetical protein [Magnetococcales bacterium]
MRSGCLVHELEDDNRDDDYCLGLREAKRLAESSGCTLIAYSMSVLSRNLSLFQEVREKVAVMVCQSREYLEAGK